jgi:acetolactate synthase-1/2/3 large subunit
MAFANPDRHVVAFMGDGSAGFHLAEIETARRAGLPITFIIGNDQRWGAEVEIQKTNFGDDRVHSCDLDADTRYDMIAEGLGAKGYFVDHPNDLASTLKTALEDASTSVVNIIISGIAAPKF